VWLDCQSRDLAERLQSLNDTFTFVLYQNVCRSLFAKDKLLFSFLLCVDRAELRLLLQGSISLELARPNPTATKDRSWLSNSSWSDILAVSDLPAFAGLATEVEANLSRWEGIYDAQDPSKALQDAFGDRWNLFQRTVLMRCLRPDKVCKCVVVVVFCLAPVDVSTLLVKPGCSVGATVHLGTNGFQVH
jgi:dynein heavy chain, axonemal